MLLNKKKTGVLGTVLDIKILVFDIIWLSNEFFAYGVDNNLNLSSAIAKVSEV